VLPPKWHFDLLFLASIMQQQLFVMRHEIDWNIPGLSTIERARLHVLSLCFIRFVVEKHGGSMETDQATHDACIKIPQRVRAACFEELGELLGPRTTRHSVLPSHK
jgi:hypothetical protein